MERNYWLGRRRASAAAARGATSAEARLVHFELAGRYSLKAAAPDSGDRDGPAYYGRLEAGARWLAGQAADKAERSEHLGHAERYLRLRLDSASSGAR